MNKIQLIATTSLVVGGLIGVIIGNSQKQINELENKVGTIQLERDIAKSENYQLHLDLIKNGNPYNWEPYGDSYGSWGYRKSDESAMLGTVGDGYIYLTPKN